MSKVLCADQSDRAMASDPRFVGPVEIEFDDLPIKVVPDWDKQLKRADVICRLVDRHLDYEARPRLILDITDFRPDHLCPEQRVQMVSDIYAATYRP